MCSLGTVRLQYYPISRSWCFFDRSCGQSSFASSYRHRRCCVKDIAALKLPAAAARLTYFSACSTVNSTSKLVDEVTHIASSFHTAGFINIIGTLWLAEFEACHEVVAEFYSTFSKTGNVAVSYHNAITELMKQKPYF